MKERAYGISAAPLGAAILAAGLLTGCGKKEHSTFQTKDLAAPKPGSRRADVPRMVICPRDGSLFGYNSVAARVYFPDPSEIDADSLKFSVTHHDPDAIGPPVPVDTSSATVSNSGIRFTHAYPDGTVKVRVEATDIRGNSGEVISTFKVQTGPPPDTEEPVVWITRVEAESADAAVIEEGGAYYTNSPTVNVHFAVRNVERDYVVSIAGSYSSSSPVKGARLFEGTNSIFATLSAGEMVTVSPEERVALDTEGPDLAWSSPSQSTTEGLGFLYLNACADDIERRVYRKEGLSVEIEATDEMTGISANVFDHECRMGSFHAEEQERPRPHFVRRPRAGDARSRMGTPVEATIRVEGDKVTFSGFAEGVVEEKARDFRFIVADRLGNRSSLVMSCRYDGTPPSLARAFVRGTTLVYVEANEPIYSFGDGGEKYDYGKLRVGKKLAEGVTEVFRIRLTDLAGNTAQASIEVKAGASTTNVEKVLEESEVYIMGLPFPWTRVGDLRSRGRPVDFSLPGVAADAIRVGDQTFTRVRKWTTSAGTIDMPDGCFVDMELFDRNSEKDGQWIRDYAPVHGDPELCKGRLFNIAGATASGRRNRPGRRPVGVCCGGQWLEAPYKAILVEFCPPMMSNLTKKVWIRGWFGKDMVGESGHVVFGAADGAAGVTPSQTTVVIDDPANRDIVQAIECDVDFSRATDSLGLWDIEVECGEVQQPDW